MKKQFLLLAMLIGALSMGNAQNITFTDEVFKQALIDKGVDTNEDGEISITEAEAVTSLSITGYTTLTSLDGIEYFTNLTYLNANSNKLLTTVDVSSNIKLTYLNLYYCYLVTDLNISENTELTELELSYCSLTNIDVSNSEKLTDLILFSNEGITTIDVSNNTELTSLNLGYTNVSEVDARSCSLTFLNLSDNTSLDSVYMTDQPIETFGLNNNTSLEFICVDEEYLEIINDELEEEELTGVIVSSDCNDVIATYEFSDVLTMWPNPTTTGELNISVNDFTDSEDVTLTSSVIYTSEGSFITTWYHGGVTEDYTTIFSGLSAGTYIINVYTSIGIFKSTFIKQ